MPVEEATPEPGSAEAMQAALDAVQMPVPAVTEAIADAPTA